MLSDNPVMATETPLAVQFQKVARLLRTIQDTKTEISFRVEIL